MVVSKVALEWAGSSARAAEQVPATSAVSSVSGESDPWHPQRKGRTWSLPEGDAIEDYSVFYVGGESATLTHLMLTLNKWPFYTFDPSTGTARKETLDVNRALMKRYYLMQKARDAEVIGIIVSSLSIGTQQHTVGPCGLCLRADGYLQVADYLRLLIKRANRKSYMCVMGKLNTAKMANFMEVDVFVLVASPENTIIDSKVWDLILFRGI